MSTKNLEIQTVLGLQVPSEIYLSNIKGESQQAKWAEGFANPDDKEFIPCEVMQVAMKLSDPESTVSVLDNTDGFNQSMYFIRVKVKYLGQIWGHIETLVKNDPKEVDKAIRIATTKAISLATGIGVNHLIGIQEVVEEAVGEVKPVDPVIEEVVEEVIEEVKQVDPVETEKTVIEKLAESLIANTEDQFFMAIHKASLSFLKDNYGVDYLNKDVKTLTEALTTVPGVEKLAAIILKEDK